VKNQLGGLSCPYTDEYQGRVDVYLQVAVNYIILVAMLHSIKHLLNAVAANTGC